MFQSTLPRGERPPARILSAIFLRFQSTLPRGERLVKRGQFNLNNYVSIHAPTWGATRALYFCLTLHTVSIHAPTWGATLSIHPYLCSVDVSIHAPTWGATAMPAAKVPVYVFQSTLPRGERLII